MEFLKEIPLTPFEKGGNYSPTLFKGRGITLLPSLKGGQLFSSLFKREAGRDFKTISY